MFDLVTFASSTVATSSLFALLLWLFRGLIGERLKNAVRAEYDEKLERLKADLQREHGESLAHLQKELDVLREKEVSGYHDKLHAYRLVIDVFSEVYADVSAAISADDLPGITDKYNREWVRCYGYLSLLAPQKVMGAFDRVNDYILQLLSGRVEAQPWVKSRELALAMINEIRCDVGIDTSAIEYHGNL